MQIIFIFAVLASLTACASRNVELQQDGTGTDEMRPSPCACTTIPYEAPSFRWVTSDEAA